MTSLSKVAIATRKIIRYGIFFLIFLIVARIGFFAGNKIYRHFFPKPPPVPTVSFGKLPKLPFPEKAKINLNFALETPEGGLPALPSQAKVFLMPNLSANLLSLDSAKEKADSLGFDPNEQSISSSMYKFRNLNSEAVLETNIINGNFSVSYDLKKDASPIENNPPGPEIAASALRSFLSSASLLPADIEGPTTHEFLKIEGDGFSSALSLSEADLVKINLYRKNYDNLASLPPNPNQANLWFYISGAREREKQIVAGEFHYFPVDESQSSTYPIKTAQTAWEELINSQVFVASSGFNQEGGNVKIRRVYLAYFDAGQQVQFFQPIIVFEGDNGFIAYTPAVTSDYYGE